MSERDGPRKAVEYLLFRPGEWEQVFSVEHRYGITAFARSR